ncbi:MAG: endonuclease/exonuclease/phosphatase family protein [Candidatus Sumerlaeia bacterium]|nr:endonuclease/exonuclease/phosphatase family protein [Candidatus Sumerlaeia bacterium]
MRSLALPAALALAAAGGAWGFDPRTGDFERADPAHVRVVSYNVERNFIATPDRDPAFQRIFLALRPDVIAFQEIPLTLASNNTARAAAIKARLESYFPGQTWTVAMGQSDGFIQCALATRFPLSLTRTDTSPASEVRGVLCGLVDLPDAVFGGANLYAMNVHFKSGGTESDHQRRQVHADAVASWMRDLRTAGGTITLPAGTPLVALGDFNLGFEDQGDLAPYFSMRTLLDGDLFDNATWGADGPQDWDGTRLGDAAPYDWNNNRSWTQPSSGPDSRLDRIYFTDSVLRAESVFILNSATMSAGALAAAGLQSGDSANAADHLPLVADFAPGATEPPRVLINEFSFNDIGGDDRTFVELVNLSGTPVNLEAPDDYWLALSNSALPTSAPGSENESSRIDLRGIVPPNGVFVLYDGNASSAAIAAPIESATDSRHRQDTAFSLTNFDDSALALLRVDSTDLAARRDAVVEAYLYAATTPQTSRYFRTASATSATITLGTAQQTTFGAGSAPSDQALARFLGDGSANDFAGWGIPRDATPGLPNGPAPGSGSGWFLY